MIKKMSADLMCKIVKERPISMCNIPYCVKNNHCIFETVIFENLIFN